MSKICSKCGTINDDTFNFCEECGNPLTQQNNINEVNIPNTDNTPLPSENESYNPNTNNANNINPYFSNVHHYLYKFAIYINIFYIISIIIGISTIIFGFKTEEPLWFFIGIILAIVLIIRGILVKIAFEIINNSLKLHFHNQTSLLYEIRNRINNENNGE